MDKKRNARFVALLLALVLVASLLYTFPAAPVRAAAVRIMPLGDSITGSPGCWRALLWSRLQNSGYTNIDFVGTLPAQGCGIPYDGDNEGHGGILATDIANQDQLPPWLTATNPDIVMMHLGTNDRFNANNTTAMILAAYTKMVGQMRANNPSMKILVAQIIPMYTATTQCTDCYQRVIELNAAIPAWAAGLSTSQSPIIVVDQWTGFDTNTDTGDGIHPNDAGNQKMSDRWYPALSALLDNGPTSTPTPTSTGPTSTRSSTPTRTNTPTISLTPVPGLRIQLTTGGTDNTQQSTFHYKVINTGSGALTGISVRVYFTLDGTQAASNYVLEKYYDQAGSATVTGPTQASGSTYYFNVSYGTASLAVGSSWEFDTAMHLIDWSSNFSGSNDWWHTGSTLPASFTDWPTIPAYLSGARAWGSEPGGGTTFTPTFTPTRSNTPTRSSTPTNTATGATSSPTRTPTRSNTPTRSSTPTNTATGATNTPSWTPTRSNTPTRTSTATHSRTSTPSPTGSIAPCSPATAITVPFPFDGAGTFCWQISSLSFINSWNVASLTVNGVDFTNKYATPADLPAKINGFWYIRYTGNFAWSHFEAK